MDFPSRLDPDEPHGRGQLGDGPRGPAGPADQAPAGHRRRSTTRRRSCSSTRPGPATLATPGRRWAASASGCWSARARSSTPTSCRRWRCPTGTSARTPACAPAWTAGWRSAGRTTRCSTRAATRRRGACSAAWRAWSSRTSELTLGDPRLVVDPVGAALASWSVAGRELLDGPRGEHDDGAFRGKLLAPWPSRLRDGRYRFGGVEHRTPLTEPERHNALHGLTTRRTWRSIHASPRRLVLAHDLPGEEAIRSGWRSRPPTSSSPAASWRRCARPTPATRPRRSESACTRTCAPGVPVDDLLRPSRTDPCARRRTPAARGRPGAGRGNRARLPPRAGDRPARARHVLRRPRARRRGHRARRPVRARRRAPPDVWMDERFGFVQVYTGDTLPDPARGAAVSRSSR